MGVTFCRWTTTQQHVVHVVLLRLLQSKQALLDFRKKRVMTDQFLSNQRHKQECKVTE